MAVNRIHVKAETDDAEKFVKSFRKKLEEYSGNAESYNMTFKSQKIQVFSSPSDAINDFKAEQVSMNEKIEVFDNELDDQIEEIADMYTAKVMKDILGE
jgi:hypothetical protein